MIDAGTAIFINDGTQDIIQYRLYSDNGTLLGTYSVNNTISSNSNSELTLPFAPERKDTQATRGK